MQFRGDGTVHEFKVGDSIVQQVTNFRWIGHQVNSENTNQFLENQTAAAWAAFNKNRYVLTNHRINLAARITLLNSWVRSRLLYTVQAWRLTAEQERKIEVTYRSFLRDMIYNGRWRHGPDQTEHDEHAYVVTNEQLYQITKTHPLQRFVHRQSLQYTGHVSRMNNNSWQKIVLFAENENGTRGRKSTWARCGELLGGISDGQVRRVMQDKGEFNRIIDERFGPRYV